MGRKESPLSIQVKEEREIVNAETIELRKSHECEKFGINCLSCQERVYVAMFDSNGKGRLREAELKKMGYIRVGLRCNRDEEREGYRLRLRGDKGDYSVTIPPEVQTENKKVFHNRLRNLVKGCMEDSKVQIDGVTIAV